MIKYPKIETIYNRSVDGNNKLIIGSYRNPIIEMLHSYPIWDAYEKLDGSNHQIYWDGHTLTLNGRTENSNIPNHILDYYNSKFNNSETEELFEQLFADKQVILFFEAIGPKIQTYGSKYCDEVKFVLLDVYLPETDHYIDYNSIISIAKAFNVDCKKLIMTGTLDNIIEYIKLVPMSLYSKYTLPMEGVVCLPNKELKDSNNNRIVVKIKGKDHTENFDQLMKKFKL